MIAAFYRHRRHPTTAGPNVWGYRGPVPLELLLARRVAGERRLRGVKLGRLIDPGIGRSPWTGCA